MKRDAIGPLLRGIGSTVILAATVIAFLVAQHDREQHHRAQATIQTSGGVRSAASTSAPEPEESLTDDIIENRWFEMLSFAGSAIVAGSFYAEWLARRAKTAHGPV